MIDAGLPLVQCLDILGNQEEDKNFAEVILQTRSAVEGGAALADAMRKFPNSFDPLFTNMIAAGEAGGILDTILKRLAVYIEKNVKLKGQVKSAMIYPIAVIVIAGVVVGVILWKVIPTFAAMFAGLGAAAAAADAYRHRAQRQPGEVRDVRHSRLRPRRLRVPQYYKTDGGRHVIDALMLKLPVLGMHPAQDRGGALLPDAVDAHRVGRADSRRPRDHGEDVGQRHRRGRHHGDAQEHRARRNDLGAARRKPTCSRRW